MTTRPSLLFDLDGTLADTARDLCHTMNVVLQQYGRPTLAPSHVRNMVGAGARKILERGFALTGEPASDALLDQSFDTFLAYYADHIADHTVLFPGVRSSLTRFAEAGCHLAVCTNKPERLTRSLLDALGITVFFPVVIGGDTLSVRKPDPFHLTEAVALLGGGLHAAVMVGDSASDIDAARAAQIPSICVTFGYTETPAADLGAHLLIDDFDELPAALTQLLPEHSSFFGR